MFNCNELIKRLREGVIYAKYTGQHIAVVYVILNMNKGSENLQTISSSEYDHLKSKENENITLFHLKENHFCFMVCGIHDKNDIGKFAKQLTENHATYCCFSVGIAVFPTGGLTALQLIQNAKTAALKSHQSKLNEYHFYKTEVQASVDRLIAIESALPYALSKNELFLNFQPQFSLKENKLVGVEALIRWSHPELGMISPAEFIPIAEKSNLIFDIGEWVLREACQHYKSWVLKTPIFLAVNLSPRQLFSHYIVERILQILKDEQFLPSCLELEITENEFVSNSNDHLAQLKRLAQSGITIAIDDFGTGYASIQYIKKLPVNKIKLDISFIDNLPYSGNRLSYC
ncbi:MAG: hypothetical protein COY58_00860 [Gammaproteobacteria bacterium CG_4_10_14_0_8_um_filter_38_16]|nr:MAG: hypothetical protein COY58_00860 [Gammaproteobacteria bacterium CG_4_10_14_0_8_um_filter_38_16]PJA03411.1 MAG: hypothetical protein COX72_05370 [Gammaproteobacteria bacterium CG_4_10_14_0_2_um_filter_38_22]PJB09888.1 MAG: hypothetical protein CO120_07680 [Gammaproteobacteria bacterium CG_4_9_14_3_um_filter_38_9]